MEYVSQGKKPPFAREAALYAAGVAACAGIYVLLNQDLALSLLPHQAVLGYLFHFDFVFVENVGYAQTEGLFTIARSCMGAKLFVNLYLLLVFGFLHKYAGAKRKIGAMLRFCFIALASAFAVTIARIAASVPFCGWSRFTLIHNAISLALYFSTGLVLYALMERRANA